MKGFKTVAFALLASAALAFAQTNGVQTPAAPVQGPQSNTYQAAAPGQPQAIAPGTVNYVEGQVLLDNQPLRPNEPLALQAGQTLTSGTNGFAEVLLTPGAFLRLGHDSQIVLTTAGLADTRAQLIRGIAIVEVDQLIEGTNLSLALGGASAQLEKKGLYDFDAGQQTVRVLDGKARVTEGAVVKTAGKHDQLSVASVQPLQKSHFDENQVKTQPLYVWSEARSQDESQANVALAQNLSAYGGWNGPGWYWDPYWSFYAYLPASGFLYSPFGWGFYSPGFVGYYGAPYGYGYGYHYYNRGHFDHDGHYGIRHAYVGGVNAHVHGFSGNGGFHGAPVGGGFRGAPTGGGFHGGGHR